MKPSLTKPQALKIGKAALYIALSAVISYLLTLITNQPELFGALTPLINVVLVFLKQLFTQNEG